MLDWMRRYRQRFGVLSVLLSPLQQPLYQWRDLADSGDEREALRRAVDAIRRSRGEGTARDLGIAVLTGRYLAGLEYKPIVVDVDGILYPDTPRRLAKEGFVVVRSVRGIHVHAFVKDDVYLARLYRLDDEGRRVHAGEAASLMPHLWTSPPTRRMLSEDKVHVYKFVLPSGDYTASVKALSMLEPPRTTLADIAAALETLEAIRFELYTAPSTHPEPRLADVEGAKKRPVFRTLEEMTAWIVSSPLAPPCLAVITALALYNAGFEDDAELIASRHEDLLRKLVEGGVVDGRRYQVRHGYRFLYSAVYTLSAAHLVDDVKLDDIYEVLGYAVEDWPSDEGQNLDVKLSYLVLRGQDGSVHPRYSRLGVIGHQFESATGVCRLCPYRETCVNGKSHAPWRVVQNLSKLGYTP